ncbi:uncharacterized protein CLUP02_10736 [Colletotrichum lupini]|uniref:Uncharacterized protein n=1 Tax=Colletotrichum lupini TaxID=145971 RepID=A0A9Q8WJ23_9PEZI|nr:uncharacterized protein CLUP02_10736 [Colletotrichum lupini]UQC85239.1 hypothetical protein CLUP02_10736 [Colletotrichum lupini]
MSAAQGASELLHTGKVWQTLHVAIKSAQLSSLSMYEVAWWMDVVVISDLPFNLLGGWNLGLGYLSNPHLAFISSSSSPICSTDNRNVPESWIKVKGSMELMWWFCPWIPCPPHASTSSTPISLRPCAIHPPGPLPDSNCSLRIPRLSHCPAEYAHFFGVTRNGARCKTHSPSSCVVQQERSTPHTPLILFLSSIPLSSFLPVRCWFQ